MFESKLRELLIALKGGVVTMQYPLVLHRPCPSGSGARSSSTSVAASVVADARRSVPPGDRDA